MKIIGYTLQNREDCEQLVDRLVVISANPNPRVSYRGDCKMIDESGKTSDITTYLFQLDNGAGVDITPYISKSDNGASVVSSREGGLVKMSVDNPEHARSTKKLLSQLTEVPARKFIPAR